MNISSADILKYVPQQCLKTIVFGQIAISSAYLLVKK